MNQDLFSLAGQLGQVLNNRGDVLVTAESCTGGWIAELVTEVAGSSAWFDRGFVTYSNSAKIEMLGVNPDTLRQYGAVSEQTVLEMVTGALARSHASLAVAVSGIAGPEGGTPAHPVGTVWLAWQRKHQEAVAIKKYFVGDRHQIRGQTVQFAVEECLRRYSGFNKR